MPGFLPPSSQEGIEPRTAKFFPTMGVGVVALLGFTPPSFMPPCREGGLSYLSIQPPMGGGTSPQSHTRFTPHSHPTEKKAPASSAFSLSLY